MTDTKRQRLADHLIGEIKSGRYKPGDRLPSLRELKLDWGESTVLAAMRILVAEGWAKATVGAGTFVADPLPAGKGPSPAERIAELEAQVAELKTDIADFKGDRALLGQLQAELIELYSRMGQPYPGAAQKPAARKRRTG